MVSLEEAREITKYSKEEVPDKQLSNIILMLYSLSNKVIENFKNCHE